MSLARIAPGPKGFDIRTFECARCDQTVTLAAENAPVSPIESGRLNSDPSA